MDKDTKINQAKSLYTVNEQQKPRSVMSMLSNQMRSLDVKELLSLETIRIRDLVENLKESELNSEFIKCFKDPTWLRKESGDWPMTKIDCEVKEVNPKRREVTMCSVNVKGNFPWYAQNQG
ncbi:hypothetical protein TNCV_2894651 [Trichonephila clavipes]|nr:hypothetical protein TNCV_2894651 [Trichonephila clavipes]